MIIECNENHGGVLWKLGRYTVSSHLTSKKRLCLPPCSPRNNEHSCSPRTSQIAFSTFLYAILLTWVPGTDFQGEIVMENVIVGEIEMGEGGILYAHPNIRWGRSEEEEEEQDCRRYARHDNEQ